MSDSMKAEAQTSVRDASWRGEFLEQLAGLPHFPALMERAGFVEYWREVGWPPACRPDGDSYVCGQP